MALRQSQPQYHLLERWACLDPNGCLFCTMDAHEYGDGRPVSGLVVYICEGCQEGYHSHCIRDRLSLATAMPGHGLSDVSWSDPSLVERHSTWRCGDCVEDDWWGVRSLVESMLTSAPLSVQRSLPRTLFSLISMLTLPRQRPAFCMAVSPGGGSARQHKRRESGGRSTETAKPEAGRGRRPALEAASSAGAQAHDRQTLVSPGHDSGTPRGHSSGLGEVRPVKLLSADCSSRASGLTRYLRYSAGSRLTAVVARRTLHARALDDHPAESR